MSPKARLAKGTLVLLTLPVLVGCSVPDAVYARLLGENIEFVVCDPQAADTIVVDLSETELSGDDLDTWELTAPMTRLAAGTVITTGTRVDGFTAEQEFEHDPGDTDYLTVTLVVGHYGPSGQLQSGQVGVFSRDSLSQDSWTGPGCEQEASRPC